MTDRKFRPELRVLAALVLAVAVAVWFARSGSSSPAPAGSGPGLRADFAARTQVDDPAAIGADDAAGGLPGTGSAAAAVRAQLRELRLGYSGTSVPEASQSADRQVALARGLGQAPVVSIPDTVTAGTAAALVRRFRAGPAGPVRRWLISATAAESAAAYSARFNVLCDAMKAAAPGISVGGGAPAGYDQAFLRTFLRGSGTRADSVGFGFYGERAGAPETGGQLAAALAGLSGDLRATRSLLAATVPARAPRIAIVVDGWDIADSSASVRFTGFAAMWDADVLGRVLAAGAVSLAAGAGGGLLYDGRTEAPRAYQVGSPTPLYAAIGMFTGEGRFPRFGTDVVTAASALPGVDVFASAAPDEVVVVNTGSAARTTVLGVSGDAPLRATQWRLTEANGAVSAPVSTGTATSRNGSFSLSLPAGSVTTVVITRDGTSTGGAVTVANVSTGQCLAADGPGGVVTARCDGGPGQRWRLAGTTLVNERSGRCLTADAAGHVSAAACAASAAGNWYNLDARLVSALTGRCLNGSETAEVYALTCDGASQQNWSLRATP